MPASSSATSRGLAGPTLRKIVGASQFVGRLAEDETDFSGGCFRAQSGYFGRPPADVVRFQPFGNDTAQGLPIILVRPIQCRSALGTGMKRREFIGLVTGAAMSVRGALAQQAAGVR